MRAPVFIVIDGELWRLTRRRWCQFLAETIKLNPGNINGTNMADLRKFGSFVSRCTTLNNWKAGEFAAELHTRLTDDEA